MNWPIIVLSVFFCAFVAFVLVSEFLARCKGRKSKKQDTSKVKVVRIGEREEDDR